MSRFTEALVVTPLADGATWVIVRPFGYDVGREGSGDRIEVRVGFMTDFASIPRLFWIALPKWGKYGNAAVIHDWLYWTQSRSRPSSDRILREGMEVLAVPRWQRLAIYWAVRAFGGLAWARNHWDRDAGFDRVLSTLPLKATESSARPGLVRRTWTRLRLRG